MPEVKLRINLRISGSTVPELYQRNKNETFSLKDDIDHGFLG